MEIGAIKHVSVKLTIGYLKKFHHLKAHTSEYHFNLRRGSVIPKSESCGGYVSASDCVYDSGYVQTPSSWRQDTRGSAISPYVQAQPGCPEGLILSKLLREKRILVMGIDAWWRAHGDHVDHGDSGLSYRRREINEI